MILSLYASTKQRCFTKNPSTHNASGEKQVGRRSIQGYKDIERLNQLVYETRTDNEESCVNSSTAEHQEGWVASNKILIDILSRTISRMDGFDSQLQQVTFKIDNVGAVEENAA